MKKKEDERNADEDDETMCFWIPANFLVRTKLLLRPSAQVFPTFFFLKGNLKIFVRDWCNFLICARVLVCQPVGPTVSQFLVIKKRKTLISNQESAKFCVCNSWEIFVLDGKQMNGKKMMKEFPIFFLYSNFGMVDEITDKRIHYENMRPGKHSCFDVFWWPNDEWEKKKKRIAITIKTSLMAARIVISFFEWGEEKFIVAG